MDSKKVTLSILISIVIVGLIAIPFGNPKFFDRALALEASFIILTFFIWKGYNKAVYACIPIAMLVIIGNSLAPPHVNLMLSFSKPLNAIVLIIGGYILQFLLIFFSLKYIIEIHSKKLSKTL
ncbi:MAG TPA: hypothetical protein VJ583_08500 [Nitrososphaeraceae archaeon]|jgi:hypothetical protein|nr:hypothetical protein [Nitrososphaeraceae archaeon]